MRRAEAEAASTVRTLLGSIRGDNGPSVYLLCDGGRRAPPEGFSSLPGGTDIARRLPGLYCAAERASRSILLMSLGDLRSASLTRGGATTGTRTRRGTYAWARS